MADQSASTLLFRDPRFLGHDTGDHPEHPSRYAAIERELQRRDMLSNRQTATTLSATDEQILRVHNADLLQTLEEITAAGGAWINQDTLCAADSLETARYAAGAAVAAVDFVIDGPTRRGFALGRPPGHHATTGQAMGFCLLNSISIAAAHALARGMQRVAIIDWDVHHGNGTQDIFYRRSAVLYCSIHQSPWFPGTGGANEIGAGDGVGTTLNVPLRANAKFDAYRSALADVIAPAVRSFRPELILISAGFDAHKDDPLGLMRLTDDDFATMTNTVVQLAEELTDGELVAVLEGGYNIATLARNVADMIERLDA